MAISKLGSRGIVDNSILAADFAPGTVTSAKLAGSIGNDKLANSAITIGGEAISLGGTDAALNLIDWQSKITSDGSTVTTMVAGRGYFVDNSSAAGIVKLPSSATIGQQIAIKDYAGNFGTNKLTIQRNSHNIQGQAVDSQIGTNRASVVLVYVDSTKGWLYTDEHNVDDLQTKLFTEATGGTITTSGDFKIHTFTGDANFIVSQIGNAPVPGAGPANVDYLVVAGGGGSGRGQNGHTSGGGGAGGHRTTFPSPGCNAGAFPVTAQTYPITVGGGGAGCTSGSNSVFSTITSAGGGKSGSTYTANGTAGGSGGGGRSDGFCGPGFGSGGAGNTPPVSPPQGNAGGNGDGSQPTRKAGGGGGAGTAGTTGTGGNGSANSITGSSVTRAGGGGGGAMVSPAGSGGPGGGGDGGFGGSGSPQDLTASTAGSANTGGGGGGYFSYPSQGSPASAVAGGSGVVIIRYKYQ